MFFQVEEIERVERWRRDNYTDLGLPFRQIRTRQGTFWSVLSQLSLLKINLRETAMFQGGPSCIHCYVFIFQSMFYQ